MSPALRAGQRPHECLVDAAFTDKASVDAFAAREVTLYGAVPERLGAGSLHAPLYRFGRSQCVAAAHGDGGGPADLQGARADQRAGQRGRAHLSYADRMLVRGAGKVLCVALWNAAVFNLLRWFALTAIR